MAAPKKNSSVITVRAKDTIALPPMTLGFSSLIKPDEYDPEKPTFKLNGHLTPDAIQQLIAKINEAVYTEDMLAKLADEAAEGGMKLKAPQDAADWLEGKLKEPREGARLQLPHIVLSNRAYMGREGEKKLRVIGCWDANNRKLNLAKLRLGAGSVIQPIVFPNLFASKVAGNVPTPSLKLVGVRVLSLVQWGGTGSTPAEVKEEELKAVLGDNFKADDLAAYLDGALDEHEDEDHEDEDGNTKPPRDSAKGMF